MPSTSINRSRVAHGAVDTKKTGSTVWRIAQNVEFEGARLPHTFRSPIWLLGHVRDARGRVSLSPTSGWLVAGVHPAAIWCDIGIALPIWTAMYASHSKESADTAHR